MKSHIKFMGTGYYLCGLKLASHQNDATQPICMQCGFIAHYALLPSDHYPEVKKALSKLKERTGRF